MTLDFSVSEVQTQLILSPIAFFPLPVQSIPLFLFLVLRKASSQDDGEKNPFSPGGNSMSTHQPVVVFYYCSKDAFTQEFKASVFPIGLGNHS